MRRSYLQRRRLGQAAPAHGSKRPSLASPRRVPARPSAWLSRGRPRGLTPALRVVPPVCRVVSMAARPLELGDMRAAETALVPGDVGGAASVSRALVLGGAGPQEVYEVARSEASSRGDLSWLRSLDNLASKGLFQ